MHEYDVAFKLVLREWSDLAIREVAGAGVARWLNVEMPEVLATRVDLLGETEAGGLMHIELQSTNDPLMPLRMAEYCLRVVRVFGRFPDQVLLYVGEAPLRMQRELNGPAFRYTYRLVDIRDLDGERLMRSRSVGDNIVAILTRLPDARAAVREIVGRISGLQPGEREAAMDRLLILAGLRNLGGTIREEAENMPITNDILDHDVIGPEWKKAQMRIIRRLIEHRFGAVPAWLEERLSTLSIPQLEDTAVRLMHVGSLEELLPS